MTWRRSALWIGLTVFSCTSMGCYSAGGKWRPATEPAPLLVVVEPRRDWTDTGRDVTAGELIYFTATGEVSWSTLGGKAVAGVGPDGVNGSPGWNVGRGGLVGRVGEAGKAFDIGARTTMFHRGGRPPRRPYAPPPIKMPASGRLYLGFKQYSAGNNRGAFEVAMRAAEPITR